MNKNEDMYLLMETTTKVERIIHVPRAYLEVEDLEAAWEALDKISVIVCQGWTQRRLTRKA